MTIKRIVQVIIASLLVTCIFAHCPPSANAAGKKGGGTSAQSNPAKRGTANSLGSAGTSGATQGAGGGAGKPSRLLKNPRDTDAGINQNIK